MTKRVHMFGRNSLEKARLFVQEHPKRDLVILKNSRTWRIAVCNPRLVPDLKAKGFQLIDSEE